MFSHQDPATNPETNDNPFQAVEINQSTAKIGCNSAYLKSCSGFLKIFALVRIFMIHSLQSCIYLNEGETISFPSVVPLYCNLTVQQHYAHHLE